MTSQVIRGKKSLTSQVPWSQTSQTSMFLTHLYVYALKLLFKVGAGGGGLSLPIWISTITPSQTGNHESCEFKCSAHFTNYSKAKGEK